MTTTPHDAGDGPDQPRPAVSASKRKQKDVASKQKDVPPKGKAAERDAPAAPDAGKGTPKTPGSGLPGLGAIGTGNSEP